MVVGVGVQFDGTTQFCMTGCYYYSTDLTKTTRLDNCTAGSYYIGGMYCFLLVYGRKSLGVCGFIHSKTHKAASALGRCE